MKNYLITAVALLILCVKSDAQTFKPIYQNTMHGKKIGLVRISTGDTAIKPIYDEINTYSSGYFDVELDGKHGVIDTNGAVIIPIKYEMCSNITQNRAFVGEGNGFLALVNKNGVLLTGYIFETASIFQDGCARVSKNKLFGFIDTTGKQVIPCKYARADLFFSGFVTVYSNKWEDMASYIMTEGKKTTQINAGITAEYPMILNRKNKIIYAGTANEEITLLDNGLIVCQKYDPSYGARIGQLIDTTGKVVFPYSNGIRFYLDDNWIQTQGNDGFGLMSYDGKELIPARFVAIAPTKINGKDYWQIQFQDGDFFFVDETGKCVEVNGKKCPAN